MIILSTALLMSLSGCTTMILNSTISEIKSEKGNRTIHHDHLVGYGPPEQIQKPYENALMLVGTKHVYLLQAIEHKKRSKNFYPDLFNKIDPQFLILNDDIENSDLEHWHIKVSNENAINDFESQVQINFIKPLNLITQQDQDDLNHFGFECREHEKFNSSKYCSLKVKTEIFVLQNPENIDKLQYKKLSSPIKIDITGDFNPIVRVATHSMLYPFSIVADILTSPVQIFGYYLLKDAHFGGTGNSR